MKSPSLSIGKIMMIMGALGALALLLVRFLLVVSFDEPRHIVTSGYEEESLFVIWKWLHQLPVYADPHAIPYSASYFNWLYYEIYGTVVKSALQLFSLTDEWIPTLGRAFTFLLLVIACAINTRLLSHPNVLRYPLPLSIAFALSVLVWLGPLIGFWALTVRPDGLALFFDLIAATCFLLYFPRKMYVAIFLAALGCYLSWACKQINIVMPGAIGLFLLWERRFVGLLCFSLLMITGYGLTLYFASSTMLKMLFFVGTEVPFALSVWIDNLICFIKKSAPAWLLAVAVISKRPGTEDKATLLGWCGLLVWSLTLLPASSKVGSADNYHFIALFFMVLIVGSKLGSLIKSAPLYCNKLLSGTGILYLAMSIAAFFTGSLQGIVEQHRHNVALRECIGHAPTPVFIMSHYCSLPWMNRYSPSFMLAYNYWFDRAKGLDFQENGIGGLIEKGYFATVLLPDSTQESFDKGSLAQYQKQPNLCDGYAIYRKKENT